MHAVRSQWRPDHQVRSSPCCPPFGLVSSIGQMVRLDCRFRVLRTGKRSGTSKGLRVGYCQFLPWGQSADWGLVVGICWQTRFCAGGTCWSEGAGIMNRASDASTVQCWSLTPRTKIAHQHLTRLLHKMEAPLKGVRFVRFLSHETSYRGHW